MVGWLTPMQFSQPTLLALVAALARWLDRSGLHGRSVIGRLVEVCGDRVTLEGLTFSVDNPLITTREKGLLYLGLHESREIALVHQHLLAELPVIELGGGIGVVSCIINRKLAHPRDHIVLEASIEARQVDLVIEQVVQRMLEGAGNQLP